MAEYNVAVIGATGVVGREFVNLLAQRDFPVNRLYLFASERSLGETVKYRNKEVSTIVLDKEAVSSKKVDIAFFSAGSAVSKEMAKFFLNNNCFVIDNSSAFRMEKDVPLIVPEVNGHILKNLKKPSLIANPNCSTIQLAAFLKVVDDNFELKYVNVSTYQSVSGAGKKGIDELRDQVTKLFSSTSITPSVFPQRIAFNLIPQIGNFYPDGYCEEENKMIDETQKILEKDFDVEVTAIRVPTFYSHGLTVTAGTVEECDIELLRKEIDHHQEMVLMDDPENLLYPTLIDSSAKNEVFIGRLRTGKNNKKRVNAWIVADNVRKGAAYNGLRIAEQIIKED